MAGTFDKFLNKFRKKDSIDPSILAAKADLVDGKVPSDQLPSYVDDVLEFANLAGFPATGETGKIYVALDSGYTYRRSGSEYIQIGGQDLPVKATGAEVDIGTDDAKFTTAKALKDSHNVPSVAPGTSGNVLTSDGTEWISSAPSGGGDVYFPGTSDILYSSDDEVNHTGQTITKVKEVEAEKTFTYNVYFEIRNFQQFDTVGQIYKNGAAFGTQRVVAGSTYTAYTEALQFSAGDLIQLYISGATSSNIVYARNFRLLADKGVVFTAY